MFENFNMHVGRFCKLLIHSVPNVLSRRTAVTLQSICDKTRKQKSKDCMEAVVFDACKKTLTHRMDFPRPKIIHDDDVIVKVEWAGVCGTDVHIVQGEFPVRTDRPFPLGHETAGIIDAVGKKCVFKVGQKVGIDPARACHVCDFCRRGDYQLCMTDGLHSLIGIGRDGAWAEYIKVPQEQVHPLPKNITTQQGALGEPFSCVVNAFRRASPLWVGQKILILGSGIIGNIMACNLHHQGHRKVTVSDPFSARLELTKKLDTGFKLATPDALAKKKKEFDVIFDTTGVGKAMEVALQYMRRGGKYVVFGCAPPDHYSKVNSLDLFDKEISIVGVRINPFSYGTALKWIKVMTPRYVDYNKLGVKIYKLSEYQTALKDLKSGKIAKASFKLKSERCA